MNTGPIVRSMLRNKLRFGLIAVEIALTFAIVVNCVTVIRKARAELARPSGFADDELISVSMRPYDAAFSDSARLDAVVERDLRELRSMPGVAAATTTYLLPWQGGGSSGELRRLAPRGQWIQTQQYSGDEGTVAALDVNLIAGRTFTPEDVASETAGLRNLFSQKRERNADGTAKHPFMQQVVISKNVAELFFGDSVPTSAVGELIEDHDGDQYRVIGVIDPFYNPYAWNIGERVMLYAARLHNATYGARYLVRAEKGKIDAVRAAIEPALLRLEAGRTFEMKSIDEIRTKFHANDVLVVRVLSLVLFLVVFVTALGVVGLTSFSVAERTRQIGIRRALGAQRFDVVLDFLIENGIVSGVGVAVGVGLAYAVNVVLVNKLGAAHLQASAVFGAAGLVLAAGALATLAPAARAARVTPTTATRNV